MLHLKPILMPKWPKLAWVASLTEGEEEIRVLHGPMVEIADDWIAEAVWTGDFAEGDFDQTDLVFGSGVRIRNDRAFFVSSATMMDRLWYCHVGGRFYVANSLPALLAVANLALREDYAGYNRDINRMIKGLDQKPTGIPADRTFIYCCHYRNLVYEKEGGLKRTDKPDTCPGFREYSDYRSFLDETAEAIACNLRSKGRLHCVETVTPVSSGYDSPAVAVIARHAGCRQAVTITMARSLWRGSDSGARIAERLGLNCQTYDLRAKDVKHEEAIWAAFGRAGELNWTQFAFPEPLCVVFTGFHGDTVWDRSEEKLANPFRRPDGAGLGLSEFRLWRGLFHCCVPFWGIRRAEDIRSIGRSDEMKAWSVASTYDRPIARRIVEEADVPRDSFARRKKDTSAEMVFNWPFSKEARGRFGHYVRQRNLFAPPGLLLWLIRRAARVEHLLHSNLFRKIGLRKRFLPWRRIHGSSLLFQWANHELKQKYQDGLRGVQTETSAASGALHS